MTSRSERLACPRLSSCYNFNWRRTSRTYACLPQQSLLARFGGTYVITWWPFQSPASLKGLVMIPDRRSATDDDGGTTVITPIIPRLQTQTQKLRLTAFFPPRERLNLRFLRLCSIVLSNSSGGGWSSLFARLFIRICGAVPAGRPPTSSTSPNGDGSPPHKRFHLLPSSYICLASTGYVCARMYIAFLWAVGPQPWGWR